jgi:hypothetical protein
MFKKHVNILILFLLVIGLAFLNYTKNSFLIGWDNLLPELSDINIHRSITTTWQEYQGLGLLGGMAHAADLPRQLFVFLLKFVHIPLNLIRYLSNYLMLFIGALGTYYLSQKTLLRKFDSQTRNFGALFAALFYILNLSTIQTFYTPFETFTSFYGFLPWLLLSHFNYQTHPHRKAAILLVLVHLIASPAFYVQTIFVVYVLILTILYVSFLLKNRHKSQIIHSLIAATIVFITSAYWLMPAAYFTISSSKTTTTSAQNQIATREVILRNQEYGDIKDVLFLKGFWFDYVDTNNQNQFDLMMLPWVKHYENPSTGIVMSVILFTILIGVIFSYKRKLAHKNAFLMMTVLSLFFLINQNPPTGKIFELIQNNIPLLKDFFRSVYTKWSIVASLGFSLFFAVGAITALDLFTHISEKYSYKITAFTLFLFLTLTTAPAFQGHLISEAMRQSLPNEYLQLFDYFKGKDSSTRIANMPQHTFWGWYQTNWGYRGSGFIWYGIEQPILDRAFDVWSKSSENYYFDIRLAIYSQNRSLFEALLEKYSVNWILVDNSVVIPGLDNQKGLYLKELRSMIGSSQKIKKDKTIGFLDIYTVDLNSKPNKFIDTQSYQNNTITTEPTTDTLPASIISTASDLPSLDGKPKNCDNFNTTAFDRIYTGDQITYTATNAMSCDHLIYSSLPHSFGYNVTISHKNESGQPLLVCIEAHSSGQCEYFGYLPKSSDWTDTKITLNRLKPGDHGYTIHLYNYSIGRSVVSNSIKQVKIEPAWPPLPNTNAASNVEYAKVTEVTKHDYTYYDVVIDPKTTPGLITLNQSFDAGWKAYTFNDTPKIPLALRYLFTIAGLPIQEKNHIKNKGWENSWIIPAGSKHITIIYLPQVIQYFGFALLILLIPLVAIHKTKKAPEEGW